MSAEAEAEIAKALQCEKEIVEDQDLSIYGYNCTALRDGLRKEGIEVSVTTVIDRAKKLGCHKPRRKKVHDREMLTASIGALIQQDDFHHSWSPLDKEKWTLITAIDDCSRMILFACRNHLGSYPGHSGLDADQWIALTVLWDCLRVFRFVQGRDSFLTETFS